MDLVVAVLAPAFGPVLELSRGLVECTVHRRVHGLRRLCRGGVTHEELAPRKAQVDGDAVVVAVVMMVAGQLDHDMTRDDAVEEVLEPLGAPSNDLRERIRVLQASKRELKGHLHGATSNGCACRFRARMCGKLDQ